ncbi:WD repeat-containing protein 74 [Aphelenchoides besseyi]|nr:WD repeat-containing protein 74 [Aphelenchoides besseyi]
MPKPLGCEEFLALRNANQILDCLDSTVLLATAHRMVKAEYQNESLSDEFYDPDELLKVFYSLIFRGSELSCKKFVLANGLHFLLSALSFHDDEKRSIAYVTLQNYSNLARELSMEEFGPKSLITFFLHLIKNGVQRPNQRLPSPVTRFLCESVTVMLNPGYPMFRPLMASFSQRPALRLDMISEFNKFFFSESLSNYNRERHWILGCVCYSIHRPEDYEVLERSGIIGACLSAFTTTICNNTSKMRIIILLRNSLQHSNCARSLFDKHNLSTWLFYAVIHPTTTPVEVVNLSGLFVQLANHVVNWTDDPLRLMTMKLNYKRMIEAFELKCKEEKNPLIELNSLRMTDCFLGATTGAFKVVELQSSKVRNVNSIEKLQPKVHGIVELCYRGDGSSLEGEVLALQKNGEVNSYQLGSYTTVSSAPDSDVHFVSLQSTNQGQVITGTETGVIRCDESTVIEAGNSLKCLRIDPLNDHFLATGGRENPLKLWDLSNGQNVFTAKNVKESSLCLRKPIWVSAIRFTDSKLICTATGHHQLRLYDLKAQRRPVQDVEWLQEPITAISTTYRPEQLIVGNTRGDLALFDLRGKIRPLQKFHGFAGSIRSIHAHPTEPTFASCGIDRFLCVHNIQTHQMVKKIYCKTRLNAVLLHKSVKEEQLEHEEEDEDEPEAVADFFKN